MTEKGCLGFPKVVLRRPKREPPREILIGVCSRFIEQPVALRDGLQGQPSNSWFLAWVLNAPKKQWDRHLSPSPTPKSTRDAIRASLGQPGLGFSTVKATSQTARRGAWALEKGTSEIRYWGGGSMILIQVGFERETLLGSRRALSCDGQHIASPHTVLLCKMAGLAAEMVGCVKAPLSHSLMASGWNPDSALS